MSEKKKLRGFALLTPEERLMMAIMGGKAVPNEKRSFSVNNDLARRAGQKGGLTPKTFPVKNDEPSA